ncbi:uncharacterized protein [Rutidosis leptorrhynchoides]|uniref:uncharacterized protein n=1 Tax=Rutidosis leptorrhynchoides TaxID=125765 RepID=UPI003A99A31D
MQTINLFTGDKEITDTWTWSLVGNHKFTVKILSDIVDEKLLATGSLSDTPTMRNNFVPKKLKIFVWRLVKRRLPVRIELDKRGIDLHSVRCLLCDDDTESIDHTFIFCSYGMEVWNKVYRWWGLGNFVNLSTNEILRGNSSSAMSCFGNKVWQAV